VPAAVTGIFAFFIHVADERRAATMAELATYGLMFALPLVGQGKFLAAILFHTLIARAGILLS
jgi:hypothetical protein